MCTADAQEAAEPDAPSNAWLVTSLARRWGKAAGEATDEVRTSERLQGHVAAYVDALRTDPTLRLMRRAPLVTAVRETLMRAPEEVAVMALLTDGSIATPCRWRICWETSKPRCIPTKRFQAPTPEPAGRTWWRARMAQGGGDTDGLWVLGAEGAGAAPSLLEASSADVRDVIYWHKLWQCLARIRGVVALAERPPGGRRQRRRGRCGSQQNPDAKACRRLSCGLPALAAGCEIQPGAGTQTGHAAFCRRPLSGLRQAGIHPVDA